MTTLHQQWLDAKKRESTAVLERRVIEDAMVKAFSIPSDLNGTEKRDIDGFTIKIEGRINKKVDADKLQELAAEAGLTEHLSSLFRWRPELNKVQWDAAADVIKKALSDAITSTPGRPSFSITKKE